MFSKAIRLWVSAGYLLLCENTITPTTLHPYVPTYNISTCHIFTYLPTYLSSLYLPTYTFLPTLSLFLSLRPRSISLPNYSYLPSFSLPTYHLLLYIHMIYNSTYLQSVSYRPTYTYLPFIPAPTDLPTYLPTHLQAYLPTYTYLYLPIPTYHLHLYIVPSIYLPTYHLSTYLPIYLPT